MALSFSSDPAGKVYRSVYSPNGPTPAEQMFGMQQRRSFIEDTTEKQRRIGSVIRRVDGAPTWPPDTSTAKSVGKIEDEYIASYEIPAGENTITLSGALYEFPVLKIKGNSGSTHYISVGREGNGYTGYIGTLEPLETQEGERLCTMLRKENGDYEPLSKKRDNLNRASSSIIKRR